jgi:hypothetical protein
LRITMVVATMARLLEQANPREGSKHDVAENS